MILLICLFMPAVLAVWIYEKLAHKDLRGKSWLYHFCLNTVLINLFCFLLKQCVLKVGNDALWNFYTDMLPAGAANYLLLALPAGVVLAVISAWLEKNVEVTLENGSDNNN